MARKAAADSSAVDEIEVPIVWHKGKQEILNILWSKVRNIEFCLNSSMQAILLGFCACRETLNRYKEKACRVTVLHIKMAATHSSRAVELLSSSMKLTSNCSAAPLLCSSELQPS